MLNATCLKKLSVSKCPCFYFYLKKMIMARIQEEDAQGSSFEKTNRFVSHQKNPFRSTSYTARRTQHINQYNSVIEPPRAESPELRAPTPTNSHELVEQTCSNFMKSYIDKLKRQRKREKKRLSLANHTKIQDKQSHLACNNAPLPVIHQGKQRILIFQKMPPSSFKPSVIHHVPSMRTLDNENLAEIIKQIKQFKGRLQQGEKPKKFNSGFPIIQGKDSKSKSLLNIDTLDPWDGDMGQSDPFEDFKIR